MYDNKGSGIKISIHQPEFMPWPGFFYKMTLSDLYVILDHVQFKKGYFENRNRIISNRKEVSLITVPVRTKGRFKQSIGDVEIDTTKNWKSPLLRKIRYFYSKAPFFNRYYNQLADTVFRKEYLRIIDFNIEIINFFRQNLKISTPMLYSSQMGVHSWKGSELVMQICLLNHADIYLCGPSGKNYLKTDDFIYRGIQIEYLDFKSPVYKQAGEGFIPNLSTLDLLFNHGEDSLRIIMGGAA